MRSLVAACVTIALFLSACGGEVSEVPTTTSVEPGTYDGTLTEVFLGERTLTIDTENDTLRVFFTDSTRVMNDSLEVGFGSLVAGERVRVRVDRRDGRLNTTRIEVMEPQDDILEP